MAINRAVLPYEIYKIVASKDYNFTVAMFNSDGESTVTPLSATWMYLKPENIMIKIPSKEEGIRDEVTFWKSEDLTDVKIKNIIHRLKDVCQMFGAGFTVKDFTSDNEPKEFNKLAKRDKEEQELNQVKESIMLEGLTGSRKRSIYALENARMIINHSKFIQEEIHGARARNIKNIQIECNNERFNYPINHLPSARAMTRHLNAGGTMNDKTGSFIVEQAKDLKSLRTFIKENKDSKLSSKAKKYISNIKETMRKFQTNKGYQLIKESVSRRPIIGKKLIESRSNRYIGITGIMESEESKKIMKVISKHDLHEDYSKIGSYRKVIQECDLGLNPKSIRDAAKRLARGEVTSSKPLVVIKTEHPSEKIKSYASQMSNNINDDVLSDVLNYLSGVEPTNDIATLIQGIVKSVSLNDIMPKGLQLIPNEQEMFEQWVKKIGRL